MRNRKLLPVLSASTIAITMASTPVMAQDNQQDDVATGPDVALDGELSDDEKTLIVAGTVGAIGKKVINPTQRAVDTAKLIGDAPRNRAARNVRQLPTSTNITGQNLRQTATAKRPTSLRELKARNAARPANIANSDLGRVIQNGENADDQGATKAQGRAACQHRKL